jgi:hypothetical protein
LPKPRIGVSAGIRPSRAIQSRTVVCKWASRCAPAFPSLPAKRGGKEGARRAQRVRWMRGLKQICASPSPGAQLRGSPPSSPLRALRGEREWRHVPALRPRPAARPSSP